MEASSMKISPLVTLVAALVCAASPAAAQFTTAVVPPEVKPKKDTVATRADSMRKEQLKLADRMKDMKAWVDSAALALAAQPSPQAADTSSASQAAAGTTRKGERVTATAAGEVSGSRNETTRFKDGARAPATATQLPLLVLLGVGATLAGVALRRH
jgi:hypothetical protein